MLPELLTEIPGPQSRALSAELKRYECRNTTYVDADWPIFWQRAEGSNVWDADGNRLLDLTAAFGVAGLGHGWSAEAMRQQSHDLLHGMGDVHPTALKVKLCQKLSAATYERWKSGIGKTILSNSGFEAVESALKTGLVATGRSGVVTFRDSYHGLGYGSLLASASERFRDPVAKQLAPLREVLDFPVDEDGLVLLEKQLSALSPETIGVLLVEPIQGRAGKHVPPPNFLTILREWCDAHGVLLVFDEIFTGLNRTGKLFACEAEGVVPDMICIGKSLSGGFPISACIGKSNVMDAWPESTGEALHTSTFLGNPVGCAMALASLDTHLNPATAQQVTTAGSTLAALLKQLQIPGQCKVRGSGLMIGVELIAPDGSPASALAGQVLSQMLKCGIIMLADGPNGNVLAFTPPFTISQQEIEFAVEQLQSVLDQIAQT